MSGDELKEGEERVLDTWNGEKFNVEVVDVIEYPVNIYTSVTTTSKTFVFYDTNISGVKKTVLKVVSQCNWEK